MMEYQDLHRPTIFAHRGASAYAPENTLAAFKLAVEYNTPAIELDVKLSADSQIMVIHDQTIDRTTQGSGQVRQKTLAELREFDAGLWFGEHFKGEKIPTLEEVFETVGRQIFINIEITNYASPFDSLPERVTTLVKKFSYQRNVLFSSFNPIALQRAHRYLPEVPLGLLAFSGFSGAWARSVLGRFIPYQALHPELNDVNPELVHWVHQHGCRIHVYTVNRVQDMQRLYSLGVDGIFTDDPLLAKQVWIDNKVELL